MAQTRDWFKERLQTRFRAQTNNTFEDFEYEEAINQAIRVAWPWFFQVKVDTTTDVIYDDTLTYTLPTDLRKLCEVRIETLSTKDSGTAEAATTTTLQDTDKSWTVDEWNDNYAIVITDGTGAGQQRTITDNDADTVTVATWTTTPDATSEYVIKDLVEEWSTWNRLYHWRLENNVGSRTLRLPRQYTSGSSLAIIYLAEYTELDAGTDSTEINPGYVILAATNYLLGIFLTNTPEHSIEDRQWLYQFSDQKLEQYKVLNADEAPLVQITYRGSGASSVQAEYPF